VFETKGLNAPLEVKAGELTSTEIGSVVRPYRYEQIITPPSRPRKLAALIPSIPVAGNSIEFPRENVTAELYEVLSAQANAAQKDFVLTRTAEGFYSGQSVILSQGLAQEETVVVDTIDYETLTITAASNLTQTHPALRTAISHTFVFTPEAKVKPLSHIEFELATETVKTLATIMPVSKQMLDDAPALQAYIDTRLNEFREMAKESQILYGDKSTRQIQGILTHADIQQLDWSDGSVGDTKIDAIRRAVTLCMLSFLPPDVLVINPNDLEDVELEKGIDGHYMFAQQMVSAAGVTQLWRLQVVETSAIEEGHALVGSFRLGAIIWDRQQAEVSISDQNRDWWEKNLLGIRVEERLALSLTRPSAFVDLHFDNTPPAP
jgi:HK97 family phage major capsid protein